MKATVPPARRIRIGPIRLPISTAFPLFVSLPTTLVVSCISTARALGAEVVMHEPDRWFATWFTAYAISWSTVFPVLLVITPQIERLVKKIADPSPSTVESEIPSISSTSSAD